ncbi:MAG: hypothetical protein OWT28_07710 [Firmicutes bacterium]|nr:hypothetical protein [Bacillota bacterium]
MNIIPSALGESAETLVLWDDCPEIGIALPRSPQLITELQWGAGTLDEGTQCLILYLFFGEDIAEVYLPEVLPTAPEQSVAVWDLLLRRDPEVLKLRYGTSPLARDSEVTLLLPSREGERLADRLRAFATRFSSIGEGAPADSAIERLRQQLSVTVEGATDASRES